MARFFRFFFDRPAFRYIPKGVYEFLAVWLSGCLSVRMYLFFLPPSPPPPHIRANSVRHISDGVHVRNVFQKDRIRPFIKIDHQHRAGKAVHCYRREDRRLDAKRVGSRGGGLDEVSRYTIQNKLKAMRELNGKELLQMHVYWLNQDTLMFKLRQGRFHQIRESLLKVGLDVVKLHRERVGRLALSEKGLDSSEGGVVLDLRPGQWCFFKREMLLGSD